VQEAIRLAFDKIGELGSVRQTLLWFLEHGLQFPVHSARGELGWKRPTYASIYRVLTNPIYGGAYAYGKSEHTTVYEKGAARTRHRRKPRAQWLSFIPNAHEGYVAWERFEQIQQAISANRLGEEHPGAGGVFRQDALLIFAAVRLVHRQHVGARGERPRPGRVVRTLRVALRTRRLRVIGGRVRSARSRRLSY